MMPTAKKKLGGFGGVNPFHVGPDSPGAGSPRSNLPPSAQLQPAPDIQAVSRREIAAAAKLPLPKSSRYPTTGTAVVPGTLYAAPPSSQNPQPHSAQRQRGPASAAQAMDRARADARKNQNAWEDSTVGSMFGDTESRAASERLRRQNPGLHGRHQSDATYPQRASKSRHTGQHFAGAVTEGLPFVFGENGLIKVAEPTVIPLRASTPAFGDVVLRPSPRARPASGAQSQEEQRFPSVTPTRPTTSRRDRMRSWEEGRDEQRRPSSDRGAAGDGRYLADIKSVGRVSPERSSEPDLDRLETFKQEERLRDEWMRQERERDREREKEREREREAERRERERERRDLDRQEQERLELERRELAHRRKHTPVPGDRSLPDETAFNNTQAAMIVPSSPPISSDHDDDDDDDGDVEMTPRASIERKMGAHAAPATIPLRQANLAARTSHALRLKEMPIPPMPQKRPYSPDYDDGELNAMHFADLQHQSFDFDPQQAAALQLQQSARKPATVSERLEQYRDKDSVDQHRLFAQEMSIDEWEEAGDWFLQQFGSIVTRFRDARKAKRQLFAQFEGEIAAREEAVRGKMEVIGRTLNDLKNEGQVMMAGKDMEAEAPE